MWWFIALYFWLVAGACVRNWLVINKRRFPKEHKNPFVDTFMFIGMYLIWPVMLIWSRRK